MSNFKTRISRFICILALLACALVSGCTPTPRRLGYHLNVQVERLDWPASRRGGKLLRTKHYRIFTTTSSQSLLQVLPGFMEGAYRNYHEITGLGDTSQTESMAMYMMATRAEWVALAKHIVGPGNEKLLSIEAGGFYWPKRRSNKEGVGLFWNMGGSGALATAAHEGLHQFFDMRLKNRLPTSLEEGLCTLTEGYQITNDSVLFTLDNNPARFTDLRNAIVRQHWVPLEKLIGMDAGDVIGSMDKSKTLGFYGQLWALARFIRSDEVYREGLETMISDAANGKIGLAIGEPQSRYNYLHRAGKLYNRQLGLKILQHYVAKDFEKFKTQYQRYAVKLADLDMEIE